MSTFEERESKEDRYAWTKFKEWLDRGKWRYRRFRYAKELTAIDVDSLPLPENDKIKLRQLLAGVDFDHDGIMNRGPETWFFDLKYKTKERRYNEIYKTWVNEDDYKAYYELSESSGVPYIIVAYVHFNEDGTLHDKLYFHLVRDPKAEPKPRRFWDSRSAKYGGQKWVYEMPENEYLVITGFDVPWDTPESLVDYYVFCRKVEKAYQAWRKGESYSLEPDEYYKGKVLEEMEKGMPKAWLYNPLYHARSITRKEGELRSRMVLAKRLKENEEP